jgi:hypothetical protein
LSIVSRRVTTLPTSTVSKEIWPFSRSVISDPAS